MEMDGPEHTVEVGTYQAGALNENRLQAEIDAVWLELTTRERDQVAAILSVPASEIPRSCPVTVTAESHIGQLATIFHILWVHALAGLATGAGKQAGSRLWDLIYSRLMSRRGDALGPGHSP